MTSSSLLVPDGYVIGQDIPQHRRPFIRKSVDDTEILMRRMNQKNIFDQEEKLLKSGSIKIAGPGVDPEDDEIPFVCEEGKARHTGQASMTQSKKQYMGKDPQIVGQYPFVCPLTTDKIKHGQVPRFDTPESGQQGNAMDGRIVPHDHFKDGTSVWYTDDGLEEYDGRQKLKIITDGQLQDKRRLEAIENRKSVERVKKNTEELK